jgi:Nucleotidyltransferase domain
LQNTGGFAEEIADRLAPIPGVVAVTLGGSRAQGTHRPDSDWDFGLYYRGSIDPNDVRALGFPGEVTAPGDWAYPMNGGAWLTIGGQKVDLLYRDVADVDRWTAEAEQGRWELFRMPGYLCGMGSYVLAGEVALGRVLAGALPAVEFPEHLAERGPEKWRWEASFVLQQAEAHARREDVAACVGKACVAIVAEAHARLMARRIWALNDKGVVARADLAPLEERVRTTGSLSAMVDDVRSAVGV